MKIKQFSYIDLLRQDFSSRIEVNSRYSLRAYSKYLELSPSMLSDVLSGKRSLSVPKAKSIVKKLKLTKSEELVFLALVKKNSKKSTNLKAEGEKYISSLAKYGNKHSLSTDTFNFISEWYHYAIMATMQLDTYDGSLGFIASTISLETGIINNALSTLLNLGLVKKTNKGFYCTNKKLTTTNEIPSIALKKFHKQSLGQAMKSIDEISLDRRDISSITMSIDKSKIPQAKEMIKEFRRNLCSFLESGKKTKVYKINIQLFPIGGEI